MPSLNKQELITKIGRLILTITGIWLLVRSLFIGEKVKTGMVITSGLIVILSVWGIIEAKGVK
jgi:hypothetical protein